MGNYEWFLETLKMSFKRMCLKSAESVLSALRFECAALGALQCPSSLCLHTHILALPCFLSISLSLSPQDSFACALFQSLGELQSLIRLLMFIRRLCCYYWVPQHNCVCIGMIHRRGNIPFVYIDEWHHCTNIQTSASSERRCWIMPQP